MSGGGAWDAVGSAGGTSKRKSLLMENDFVGKTETSSSQAGAGGNGQTNAAAGGNGQTNDGVPDPNDTTEELLRLRIEAATLRVQLERALAWGFEDYMRDELGVGASQAVGLSSGRPGARTRDVERPVGRS